MEIAEACERTSSFAGASDKREKVIISAMLIDKNVIPNDKALQKFFEEDGYKLDIISQHGKKEQEREEWFALKSGISSTVEGTIDKIEEYMRKTIKKNFGYDVPKESLKLRNYQDDIIKQCIKIYNETDKPFVRIAALLYPRTGKTPTFIDFFDMFKDIMKTFNKIDDKTLMILPASWLSSHTSFEKTLNKYNWNSNIVYIDINKFPKIEDMIKEIKQARKENKKIVLPISLHKKSTNVKMKKLLKLIRTIDNGEKMIVRDEADFASHTEAKREIEKHFIGKKQGTGKLLEITMSGTNIQRMLKNSKDVDGIVFKSYSELVKDKAEGILPRKYVSLSIRTHDYLKLVDYNPEYIWTWTKMIAEPLKFESMWIDCIQGFLLNRGNLKHINISYAAKENVDVAMIFVSPATKKQMNVITKIARKSLGDDWVVLTFHSDITNNRKAEALLSTKLNKAKVENKKGVLIISNTMGSRSLSESRIHATIMCSDEGDINTFIQRSMRSATFGKKFDGETKRHGIIVDCSLRQRDMTSKNSALSGRCAKTILQETALESRYGSSQKTISKIVKEVLQVEPFYYQDDNGNYAEFEADDILNDPNTITVLEDVMSVQSGNDIKNILKRITSELYNDLMDIKIGNKRGKKKDLSLKGQNYKQNKTSITNKKTPLDANEENDLWKRINFVFSHISFIRVCFSTKGKTFEECLENTDNNKFKEYIGTDVKTILKLSKIISREQLMILDVIVNKTDNLLKKLKDYDEKEFINSLKEFRQMEWVAAKPELSLNLNFWKNYFKENKYKFPKNFKDLRVCTTGTSIVEVLFLLELGVPMKNITVIDDKVFAQLWKKSGVNYIPKSIIDLTTEEINKIMKKYKWDLCIMNPPFAGDKQMYQQFFNKVVDMFKTNDKVENDNNNVDVRFYPREVFSGATIETDLSVINYHKKIICICPTEPLLNKKPSLRSHTKQMKKNLGGDNASLTSLTYKNGTTYKNIKIEDINNLAIPPEIYNGIITKVKDYVKRMGSLQDIVLLDDENLKNAKTVVWLPKIKTGVGKSRFFTFLGSDKTKELFGFIVTDDNQRKNAIDYLNLNITKCALSFVKFNGNNHRREFSLVPLVDFDINWTDEMLMKEIGLTQQEYDILVESLNNYPKDHMDLRKRLECAGIK